MLLEITHETQLGYSDPISDSVIELRMAPRQGIGQRRLSFSLAVGPAASVTRYFDWLGNMVHTFSIMPPHDVIKITVTSVVETIQGEQNVQGLPDCWPLSDADVGYEYYDFLQFEGPIAQSPALRELVASIGATQGERLGAIAMRIMSTVATRLEYVKGVTTAASPITEVLEKQAGVCQDFTHVLIGVARSLGIPARYVSGCLHPRDDNARGFSETHAWAELYFPSCGWIGFDAANDTVSDEHFVKVALGRSFADVPPNKGVFRGEARETISVRVKSRPLTDVPFGLEPERFIQLPLRTLPVRAASGTEQIPEQEKEQQQQQQQQQVQQ